MGPLIQLLWVGIWYWIAVIKNKFNEFLFYLISFKTILYLLNWFNFYYQTGESIFSVTSQSNRAINYIIDMKVGVCTCHDGQTGGACKHQEAVLHHHAVPCSNFLPTTPSERAVLLKIATGSKSCGICLWYPNFQIMFQEGKVKFQSMTKAIIAFDKDS